MNFKLSPIHLIYLAALTLGVGCMQVITPLLLRTLVDGILPSMDGVIIAQVIMILGLNELLLVIANAFFNRHLDDIENDKTHDLRGWMLKEVSHSSTRVISPEDFYQSWSHDARRLIYKRIKNPWYRAKDFVVLFLLSFICLRISYLAGLLVIGIAGITLILVTFYQTKQGKDFKNLYTLKPKERNLFDAFLNSKSKEEDYKQLLAVSNQLNDLQYEISKERTRYQDINNTIRFIMMFSILGVGGYLFSTGKLSMGSLWALLITMYRVTPPIQSIVRWLLQTRLDDNLENRIFESMRVKDNFKKPPFYNRLVKLIEKSLKSNEVLMVKFEHPIEQDELLEALRIWKSFYGKKEMIEISKENPIETKETSFYFIVNPKTNHSSSHKGIIFTSQIDKDSVFDTLN